MLGKLRPRSVYDVIAALALFVGLGGSAYAVTSLPENSVGTKQLKDSAVATKKLRNGAVTGLKVADNSLTGNQVTRRRSAPSRARRTPPVRRTPHMRQART